jgi:hypothetical protein
MSVRSVGKPGAVDVVFVHRGCPDYLYDALPQIVRFNRHSRIHLIGDDTNRQFGRLLSHHRIEDYWSAAEAFGKVYEHHSSNPAPFECFCFQRWFVLDEFVRRLGIDRFVYLDTDTMVYCDLAGEFTKFEGFDVALAYDEIDPQYIKASGCLSFWMTQPALGDFCSYLMELYRDRGADLAVMVDQYRRRREQDLVGAVNDMSAFGFYLRSGRARITKSIAVEDASVHTRAFEDSRFECAGGATLFRWQDGVPYARRADDGTEVRVCSHQCNGPQGKASMRRMRSRCRSEGAGVGFRAGPQWSLALLAAQGTAAQVRSAGARILKKLRRRTTRMVGSGP